MRDYTEGRGKFSHRHLSFLSVAEISLWQTHIGLKQTWLSCSCTWQPSAACAELGQWPCPILDGRDGRRLTAASTDTGLPWGDRICSETILPLFPLFFLIKKFFIQYVSIIFSSCSNSLQDPLISTQKKNSRPSFPLSENKTNQQQKETTTTKKQETHQNHKTKIKSNKRPIRKKTHQNKAK